jgi:outer membrane protein assembly factor BamB
MTRRSRLGLLAGVMVLAWAMSVSAFPTVYPTGTTIYKPEKAWNGYTVFPAGSGYEKTGCVLIDMNGNTVKYWEGLLGEPGPNKMLPGGMVMGGRGGRPGHQEYTELLQVDWDGNIVWRFDRVEEIKDKDKTPFWSARQHHDYQREGNPVGYYVPGMKFVDKGKTLILSHKNVINRRMSERLLEDDLIVEVDWDGKILWQWLASDHFDEMGFDEAAKNIIARDPNWGNARGSGDWTHVNNMNYLGPNKWFDKGDDRFNPDNIIIDGRQTNTISIIDKKTGKIVWQVGPDFTRTPALKRLGVIIGMHHAHMIPKGLPGEGNILVFDNGGQAGYGAPTPGAITGLGNAQRDYSRVIEFDPITLEIKWQYTAIEAGFFANDRYKFYSHYISAAQRLPNGNTLITEGADGRIFEVTPTHELVWEYVSPYFAPYPGGMPGDKTWNLVYRAYRVPYDWVPQLPKPVEKAVTPPANWNFTVPGTKREVRDGAITKVK